MLGQGSLLNEAVADDYFQTLKKEYEFLAGEKNSSYHYPTNY
ncbi:MAG: hypothetical protein ACMUEM_01680 [Flavobacteriales bacterium AspAUS03]